MRNQWFTCIRLPNPYMTSSIPPFDRIVHHLTVTGSVSEASDLCEILVRECSGHELNNAGYSNDGHLDTIIEEHIET
jgi:hypothetical protein